MSIVLKIKRLDPSVPLPSFAYPGDAAFDLYSREDITLAHGERKGIPSGIQMEIPEGFVGLIWDKSGIAIRGGVKTLGGVVDSGYRGEVLVGVINLSGQPFMFKKGEKVAQMIIQKKETVSIEEVAEISETVRGERGFGSSGKQ